MLRSLHLLRRLCPRPPLSRVSPWSANFAGTKNTRIFIQSAIYAVLIAGTLEYARVYRAPSDDLHYASPQDLSKAIQELRNTFPDAVITDPNLLLAYGSSENSYHPSSPHSVVVRPTNTQDVVQIVNISRKFRVPVVSYGGATSLEGHFSGHQSGSICVDMSKMNCILDINEADSDLTCQAGTRWEDINETLRAKGIPLFFPLDPGPGATIGGMIGTGCSGTNAVRYGTARGEWFLNLTVVLPNGEIVKTRRRARKSSAGFDLTKLFIGAEGTLGIVTEGKFLALPPRKDIPVIIVVEVTLKLAPRLPTRVALAQFATVKDAVSAVQEILNSPQGLHLQCIELLDDQMMSAINKAGIVASPYPVKDTLFFKIQGDPMSTKLTAKTVEAIAKKHASSNFRFATTDEEAETLWQNRKFALMSALQAHPGTRCWTTDVCVPVSRLPQLVQETKQDLQQSGLRNVIVGHVGDGNFHALILFSPEELEATTNAVHRLIERAIALDGTCTGEHGVGVGKKEYLPHELGRTTTNLMWTIKKAIDPLSIMNPGKLYPDPKSEESRAV